VANGREFRFEIDAYTPETIPMERLAQYMADLAMLLGEPTSVHFVRLDRGSTVIVHTVEEEAVPKVRLRARSARSGEGPSDAITAYRRLNRRLLDDNGVGVLSDEVGAQIVDFPGRDLAEPVSFGAFNQECSVDGVVIRVGGVRDPVPVTLQATDSTQRHCLATRDLAKMMAHYLFGPELRVYGIGRWFRDSTGQWNLKRFAARRFDVLGNEPLSAVMARLRDVPGSEWPNSEDPWGELRGQRDGSSEVH
jgi:hypothetical protein